jgi:peptide/nickel transport system substrate-binding protein
MLAGALACRNVASLPDTLVVFAERDVEGLDPHTSGQVWQTQMLLANVYESLVSLDAQMVPRPALAVSWSNPDDFTWEFEIRPGVRLQGGGVLEAEDVVFSLLRAREHPRSVLRAALAEVEDVHAVGSRVRLRTRQPDAALLARLREVFIVSRRCLAEDERAVALRSCGSGPYAVAARVPGDSVDLARFDDYWGGRASIPKARFVARSYAAADAPSFVPSRGRVLFWTRRGPRPQAHAPSDGVAHAGPGLAVLYLGFDLHGATTPAVRHAGGGKRNPFLDPRVREAVARAIDASRLAQVSAVEATQASQFVSPFVAGFDPAIPPPRPDQEGARRLLAQTPFREGFAVDLDLREIHAALGPALVADLAELGIRARANILAEGDFFRRLEGRGSSLAVLRFSCWTGDAQTFFDKVVHSRRPRLGYGIFNFSYDESPVPGLDAEIEAARHQQDSPRRLLALQAVMRRVLDSHLAVPLLQEADVVFMSPDVEWMPRADTFRLVAEARFKPDG